MSRFRWRGWPGLAAIAFVWGFATVTASAQPPTSTTRAQTATVQSSGPIAMDVSSLLTGPRDDLGGGAAGRSASAQEAERLLEWHGFTQKQRDAGVLAAIESNIRRSDYAGPDACKECHQQNYEKWSRHSHRLMNALANDQTVKGDFSGQRLMNYLGGIVRFQQQGTNRFMSFERGDHRRTYRITRTIGSRFTQYYIGLLTDGPEPADHAARTVDHVLPIGWWIDRQEWVPAVHIDPEGPDGARWDGFAKVSDIPYDGSCAVCHTTPAMGDWILNPNGVLRMGYYSHVPVAFDAKGYLEAERPDIATNLFAKPHLEESAKFKVLRAFRDQGAVQHAVNLGISCENCHNGSLEHVRASDKNKSSLLPHFFPVSSNFVAQAANPAAVYRRNPETINFICARCHTGKRPYYASGMATWNSVEYSDAENGHCYIRKRNSHPELQILTCTACHDPHEPIGAKWSKTADEDDATCLKCHTKYQPETDRFRHTRHAGGTEGARCLNCHMPRITEGLQEVVRTHSVSSPNRRGMIESNQPNACNLCHLDKPIDWTIAWLSRWYKVDRYASYDAKLLAANYPDRAGPVGLGWLKSPHEPTRLVAVDALARAKAKWALPSMLNALDDPYLLNRQFARIALEAWLGVRLADHGYQFFMMPEERKAPLEKIRATVNGDSTGR